jgi:hypothetical protein
MSMSYFLGYPALYKLSKSEIISLMIFVYSIKLSTDYFSSLALIYDWVIGLFSESCILMGAIFPLESIM